MTRALLFAALLALAAPAAIAADAAVPPGAAKDGRALPVVSVARIAPTELVETVRVTGTLVAREDVVVGPELEGARIVEILVDEGDRVEKGQVLARLARDTLDAQLAQSAAQLARSDAAIAQARAAIAQAEAALMQSGPALERAQALVKRGAGTDAALDAREAEHAANKARLASAKDGLVAAEAEKKALEAARRELEVRVGRTEVKAPAAGLIARKSARLGAIASMAAPDGLFRIVAGGDVELEAEAPDFRLARIREGQKAAILDAADRRLEGTVRLVSPEIDRASRMGRLRIAVGVDRGLRVGGFARGEIETARRTALAAPASALQTDGEGPYAQLVKDGRIVQRRVKTGLSVDGRVEILDGLVDGDSVVARAGAFLREGDAVEARPAAARAWTATETR
ncbi:MAG: efflux RND transporter periplasmic adaptor subunit [Methylobacteriaceae bacterium]|nr:efflux RND transporter periplasmic adaptor subunit [Methylobacteriaceae bacterium]